MGRPGQAGKAFEFNEKRGLYLGLPYGLASGMMSTVIPKEARAVYHSRGGADMKDRISKTAQLGYDIMSPNTYAPDGEMIVTCVKTRLVHAAVRHLLPQSPYWDNVADEDIPASWAEADTQAAQVLTPVLAPPPEGIDLADIPLNMGSSVDGGILSKPVLGSFTRFVLGDRIAGWLRIPREPFRDPALRTSWGPFIAVREGLLPFPLAPEVYWLFDEFIRKATLLFLSEAKPISIEIPDSNRP